MKRKILAVSALVAAASPALGDDVKYKVSFLRSDSSIAYPDFGSARPKGGPTPGNPGPTTNIQVARFAVRIDNQEDFRIKCDITFWGHRGTIAGYKNDADTLSALIEPKSSKVTQQPEQLLLTVEGNIETKCIKFSLPPLILR